MKQSTEAGQTDFCRAPDQHGARWTAGFFGLLGVTALSLSAAASHPGAQPAYDRAVSLREALESRPEHARTRADYARVIRAFQAVYRIDPAYQKTPAALAAVGELHREMGQQFSMDDDYEASIKAYEFLIGQYPRGSLARDALLAVGDIYNTDLGRPEDARKVYQRFLERYSKSAKVAVAQQALKQIDEMQAARPPTESAARQVVEEVPQRGQLLQVNTIRRWVGPDYTRIIIGVEDEVQFNAQRVANPDRLVFDLLNARMSPALVGKTFTVEDGFLRQIRVGQYQPTVTRVVLDVKQIDDYSVFSLPNPFRLVIDIHGRSNVSAAKALDPKPHTGTATGATSKDVLSPALNSDLLKEGNGSGPTATTTSRRAAGDAADSGNAGSEAGNSEFGGTAVAAGRVAGTGGSASIPPSVVNGDKGRRTSGPLSETISGAGETLAGSPQPLAAKATPSVMRVPESPAKPSAPTGAGSRTLTRALGLKIGRIVIDPGHGGHDTGTIGPSGVHEKDLVLDVALRLKKLIETRMGSEVIMTRSDDTFIPLEERTAIANEKDADLFVSIHANASRNPSARGIETFYLNFTSDPEALEVAARENASSQESVHRLQRLIEKIALSEKIEESRELARQIQRSVYSQVVQSGGQERDRGLKKAPFVVLIGANMPSVLSEMSFLTNPRDENLLKRANYRQKIAEALYRGISRYVSNLGGVKVAQESTASLGEVTHPARRGKPSSVSQATHSAPAGTPDF
jgi:N-acetylmuramoyl-L-alanine amidase